MLNGRMSSADDPFSDMSAASPDTRDPNSLFNNDDAFASFSANDTVRITLGNFATLSFLFSFCDNFVECVYVHHFILFFLLGWLWFWIHGRFREQLFLQTTL
jgi:hypothetical protein